MGIIAKQGSWNFVIIYLGVILGTLNNMFLMPHALNKYELGIISVLLSLTLIGAQVSLFGGTQAIIKFYPRYKGSKYEFGLVNYLLRNTLISLVFSIGIYLLFREYIIEAYSDTSSLFGKYYFLYIPLLTFFVFQEFFGGYLRSLLKTVYHSVIKEIILRVYQSALYVLLLIDWIQFDLFLMCYVCGYLLTTTLIILGVRKHSGFVLFRPFRKEKKEKRSVMKFCSAIFTTGIAGALLSNIDIIMIGAMAPLFLGNEGLELAGVYGRMAYMAVLITIPLRSILSIAVPMISKAWEEGRRAELKSIYKKSSLTLTILGLVSFVGIWANIDNVFRIFPVGFEIGKYVFLYLAFGNLMQTVLGTNGPIISNSPHYWVSGIAVPLLAAMVIVTNIIFIPRYGIEGAAFATMGSRLVFSVGVYLFLLLKYKMQPVTWRNLYVGLIASITLLVVTLIPTFESIIMDVIIRSVTVLILFLPAIIIPKISPEINGMITKILGQLKLRKS